MDYSNPKIPEEINYSKENPLKEFALLVLGIFGVVMALVVLLHLLAQQFAHHIPFQYEAKLMDEQWLHAQFPVSNDKEKRDYIYQLSERMAKHMALPEEIRLNIYFSRSEMVNAFASLNGTIVITEGLLGFVESENELAFIIAHEIAHIRSRDPIQRLSSQAALGIGLSLLGLGMGDSAAQALMTSSQLTSLSFSRAQESHADALALNALHSAYGHTGGAAAFFRRLSSQGHDNGILEFISTHPDHNKRIEVLEAGHQDQTVALSPLPEFIRTQD